MTKTCEYPGVCKVTRAPKFFDSGLWSSTWSLSEAQIFQNAHQVADSVGLDDAGWKV